MSKLTADRERDIERWLTRRGIPHFIDHYSASRDVLTRAIPLLTFIFLVEAFGSGKLEWPWWANRLAEIAGLALLVGVWALINHQRGRPLLARPDHVGIPEMAVFVLVPAFLPVLFGGEWIDGLATIAVNLGILAAIYLATSYGLVPMARWGAVRMARQFRDTLRLVARGLPLLLVAFVFLFINAEVWQMASTFNGATLAAVLGMFAVVGAIFILSRLPGEIRPLAEFDAGQVEAAIVDTPAEGLPCDGLDFVPEPTSRQWGNAGLVVLFVQGLRVILAATLIGGFFVAFGLLTIRLEVIETWTQAPADVLGTIGLFGREVAVTSELMKVAAFLAGFSGMYFAVYLVTDPAFRTEFFDDITGEVRQAFAVRAAYVTALRARATD